MRWTKAPRIVETKLKSGKIKFQVVEHLVDGRRIRKVPRASAKGYHLTSEGIEAVRRLVVTLVRCGSGCCNWDQVRIRIRLGVYLDSHFQNEFPSMSW